MNAEILGVAGVAGNGQSELLEVLAGMMAGTGTMTMLGETMDLTLRRDNARTRREDSIAHVHEDRHRCGLILDFMAWENVAFGYHNAPEYQKNALLMDNHAILEDAKGKIERFDVRPRDAQLVCARFSGGNQQKLVLARELGQAPRVLLVGQPTRGVDIGAIEFIYGQLRAMRDAGCAVLVVSSELDEILALSDRVIVMNQGHVAGELPIGECNENTLGMLMIGGNSGPGAGARTAPLREGSAP